MRGCNGRGDMPVNQNSSGHAHYRPIAVLRKPATVGIGYGRPERAARPGAATIVNANGVPGTLGCLARTRREGRLVLVSSWHVLFGAGAREGDPVWLLDESHGARRYQRAAAAWYGRIDTLRYGGGDFHVDCAIATWAHDREAVRGAALPPIIARPDTVNPGDPVTKTGAATGTTAGVIIDVDFCSVARADGRCFKTPRQLLVRSLERGPFSRDGDSGALVLNSRSEAVGLLWGATPRGDGVACHLMPALYALDIAFPQGRP